ncbi:DNA polymerase III subunit delta' [Vibrio sonorensis]|uniref:DNA polymerase III subunit delta' n=1 Tax=Vibrio sonorensis TaxID=1004316 RepID=UPI0008DA3094|nr:DNA polymerase III subunit delta' [Vibrio sonorensis]
MDKLYPWLQQEWRHWQQRVGSGRFPNANLVVAPKGLGAHDLVQHLVAVLLCEDQSTSACGFCHSCQLVESGNHPDYHLIAPEKEGKGIGVDQIRQINRIAMESSQLFGPRVILIEPAENMNTSASNALLKTLEEPPENCIFILRTAAANKLLPTIVSRCQQWLIRTPNTETTMQWLADKGHAKVPSYVLTLNHGAPLEAETFLSEGKMKQYEQAEQALIHFLAASEQVSEVYKKLDVEGNESLRWIWYLLADAQKLHFQPDLTGTLPGALALKEAKSYSSLYNQSKSLAELLNQFSAFSGLNRELLIADWLFKFYEDTCS